MTLPQRIYRLALRAWPARFRAEFGEDSARDFARLVDQTHRERGRLGVALLCCRAVWDLGRTAVHERRSPSMRTVLTTSIPQNLRDAVRSTKAAPFFSLLVIATLALGIGANSAIFDAVYEVSLKPLPFPDASSLVMVWETDTDAGGDGNDVTPANFEDWRELNTSFDDLAAMVQTSMNLTGDGEPERLNVYRVSSSLFPILGVQPIQVRAFVEDEDQPSGEKVALVSHGFWQRRLGGDATSIGSDVLLDGTPHRIIGVLPGWFRFPSRDTALYIPLAMDDEERTSRNSHYLAVVGRLRADASATRASQEMDGIAARLSELYPDSNEGNGVMLRPLRDELVGEGARPLAILLLAVSAVVFIAVVNVSNLLLARSAARQQEVAVRLALGASRSRILAQLMTESAILALCGAASGMLLASWGRQLLQTLMPAHVTLDTGWWRPATIVCALVLAGAVTLGMGLLPALRLSRSGRTPLTNLRGTSSPSSTRFRDGLIVAEVASALILLMIGGLVARSFFNLTDSQTGFRSTNVLTMRVELSGSRYQEHHQKVAFYRELESRVARLPGVLSSGFTTMLPLTSQGGSILFGIEDRVMNDAVEPIAVFRSVTPRYFRTLGVPVTAGRGFDERDNENAPKVAIVNRTLAREFFDGDNPVGQRLDIWGQSTEVVGVIGDVRHFTLGDDARPAIYVAAAQRSFGFFDPRDFAVRVRGNPTGLASAVRAEVWSIDPDQPIASIQTMDAIVSDAVANERLQATLLTAFGAVALLLAALGIYGVLAYAVSQRTDEIGLRMALGARKADVLRMIAGRGASLIGAGIGLGLGGAVALGQVLTGMLHGVAPLDPSTMVFVVALLVCVASIACLAPALRATRIDPLRALRDG